ncbi:uncharacterized protein LOC123220648 isoform X2 [Mangifera indica]|uniref:uncharacterized protein LOC123220648 isoform X2 n=1 Tax=Mangifera indica TaxID=29780 RepID=UPI001CFBBE31|nr:uncharacterized protein LOC123220648 isoform X2 [Mangifera indica]
MAHSLTTTPPTTITRTPISSNPKRPVLHIPSLGFQGIWACHQRSKQVLDDHKSIYRRDVALGLAGAAWLSIGGRNASATGHRPPSPPKEEKKDPNVSGVQAKVLSSKKRKEAMKQAIAKLREKGKVLNEPVKENGK